MSTPLPPVDAALVAEARRSLGDDVADVRAILRTRQARSERGRFTAGNTAAAGPMARSAAFWEAIDAVKAELVTRARNDVAAGAEAAETLLGLVDAWAETRLMRESLYLTVVEAGGPTTTKGRVRAAYTAFMQAASAEERLAKTIGLERRHKQAIDLALALQESGR